MVGGRVEHAARGPSAAAAKSAGTESAAGSASRPATARSAAPSAARTTSRRRSAAVLPTGRGHLGSDAEGAADAQHHHHRGGPGGHVDGQQGIFAQRFGVEAAERSLHIVRRRGCTGRNGAERLVEDQRRAVIEEVVARQVVIGDHVVGLARLGNQEGIEANAPGGLVVGHQEEHVARGEAGAAVILAEVIGVRCCSRVGVCGG